MKLLLVLLLFCRPAHAFEWGDVIEYSADGQTWYEAQYLVHDDSPYCIAGDVTSCDSMGQADRHYILHTNQQMAESNYIRAVPTVTKSEMYGLLTRIENLINTNSPQSAFNTAANMMRDRESLQQRIDAIREILKND